jgi:acyl-CoA synthetase (AMP-forming)/AMP-acid ligase II
VTAVSCVAPFLAHLRAAPGRPALILGGRVTTFGELGVLAARAQRLCRRHGLRPGDAVLLLDPLGPRLYAIIIAVLALGATVVLVDPTMAPGAIGRVVAAVRPHLFIGGLAARVWGARVAAVRRIARWVHPAALALEFGGEPHVELVAPAMPGTITFTTGTTGAPKGVVRTHGSLAAQLRVLGGALGEADEAGEGAPDLVVFPALALLNLANGRPSVVVPRAFAPRAFAGLAALPAALRPTSVACGPAVLRRLVDAGPGLALRSVHVGGAPVDLDVLEAAFARWPGAHVSHVYGSTEAEPVAVADGRAALARCRGRGLWQLLNLGRPVAEIATRVDDAGLWVAGPHVAPAYQGGDRRTQALRRAEGDRLWHCMGDRVAEDADGLWYGGRMAQAPGDFALEQERLYPLLRTSACFVHRTPDGRRVLVGEGVAARAAEVRRRCPEIDGVLEAPIVRDPRHRARIDRVASVRGRERAVARSLTSRG